MFKTIKYPLLGMLAAVVAAGCASSAPTPNPIDAKITAELAQIKERLAKLEKQIKPPVTNEFVSRGANIKALGEIVFPAKPTKENLRLYIMEIVEASKEQNSFSPNDPQVRMLMKVGEENINLLFDATYGNNNYHVIFAINELASAKSKAVVLNALPACHDLAKTVWKNGWSKEAKATLLGGLSSSQYLPREWLVCIASLNDPATYPALIKFMINGNNRYQTYQIIKELPGIKITDKDICEAWQRQRLDNDNEWGRMTFAIVAVGSGELEALDMLVKAINNQQFGYYHPQIMEAIYEHSELQGTPVELREKYQKVKDSLLFDPVDKKFKVKPAVKK